MKQNFDKLMQEEITSFGDKKPKLVLHCCCAPCSSAVIERLKDNFDITYLFYNPNIFPEQEFYLRLGEFKKLGVKIVDLSYNHEEFLSSVRGLESEAEGGARCKVCIALRMKKAFEFAKLHGFDFVTTTLSISPHKDAEYINMVGEKLQEEFNIKFLHSDFKKRNGYLRSIQICKDNNIYRQDYCGCEFSKNQNQKNN